MKDLKIGEKIYDKKKKKGVTQEKLAEFLGVSPPAVSKWETSQSYPDITLLPEIASYFDVTIDYLMDFAPSLSKEEAMEIYIVLADAFSSSYKGLPAPIITSVALSRIISRAIAS
jgi:transcriptional regulator with XRE-family HTH domain